MGSTSPARLMSAKSGLGARSQPDFDLTRGHCVSETDVRAGLRARPVSIPNKHKNTGWIVNPS